MNTIASKPSTFSLFIHLLLLANHKPRIIIWNKRELLINRGQALTGRRKLAVSIGLTEMQIRTAFLTLRKTNKITIKTYSKFSIISINKYEEYQQITSKITSKITNRQPTDNQQTTTLNNDKNDKKVNKGKEIPPSLESVVKYCKEKNIKIDPAAFFNYYETIGWVVGKAKNNMKNWHTAIGCWVSRERKFNQPAVNRNQITRGGEIF